MPHNVDVSIMHVALSSSIKCACASAFLALLSACSSNAGPRQAERDFDYVDATLLSPLNVPENVAKPNFSRAYNIAEVTSQGPIGKTVDVRPPVQLLSQGSGFAITHDEHGPWLRLVLASSDSKAQSKAMLTRLLQDFLASRNAQLLLSENDAPFNTSWIESSHSESGTVFDNTTYRLAQRFAYDLRYELEGKRVALNVRLLGMRQYQDDALINEQVDSFDEQRLANTELNRLIQYFTEQRSELMK